MFQSFSTFSSPKWTLLSTQRDAVVRLTRRSRNARSFLSAAEYQAWRQNISKIRMDIPLNDLQEVDLRYNAPLFHSVEPLAGQHLQILRDTTAPPRTPRHSLLVCKYPLATDKLLRYAVSDLQNWSSFRLGKFYEAVDALTGDVAYAHIRSGGDKSSLVPEHLDIALVTAGHYHSRKLHKTNIHRDAFLRCYVTAIGKSSMEVRTDALQLDDNGDQEILLNVCHTILVALDRKSLPPLALDPDGDPYQDERAKQAERHKQIRNARQNSAMQLSLPVSHPPTANEMRELHECYRNMAARQAEEQQPNATAESGELHHVRDYTFRSSHVIFPEQRNVHGKLFGGYSMEQAQNLAQYAATFLSQGRHPIIPLGIDEAIFLQPISIGDLVTFCARVVHTASHTCRVQVTVEVRDPAHLRPRRASNRLTFLFASPHFPAHPVLPETYSEILLHIDAQRRYAVEGPTEDEVARILEESHVLEQTIL